MAGFQFTTIKPGWFPLRILIAAEPSGGKSLSAIRMGLGLADGNGKKLFFLDTDAGRGAALYGQELAPKGIQYARFDPPFSPARFGEGIQAAEDAGAEVLIIDCASDEMSGVGGLAYMAEADKGSWLRPKNQHFLKFVNRANTSHLHIIFTAMAKTVSMPEKEKASFQLKNASRLAAPDVQLEVEKSFTRPMTICLFVAREGQEINVFKAHTAIQPTAQKITAPITEEHGRILRAWSLGTGDVDLTVERYRARFRQIAEQGVRTVDDAISKTSGEIIDKLGKEFFDGLYASAAEYDAQRAAAQTEQEVGN